MLDYDEKIQNSKNNSDNSYKEQILNKINHVNIPSNYHLNNVVNGQWGCIDKIKNELSLQTVDKLYSLKDLMENRGIDELLNTLGTGVNNNYSIDEIIVKGCASSHGREEWNEELCRRRGNAASKICKYKLNIDDNIVVFEKGQIINVKNIMDYDDINSLDAKIARCAIITIRISLNENTIPEKEINETFSDYKDLIINKPEMAPLDNNTDEYFGGVLNEVTITVDRDKENDTFSNLSKEKFIYDNEYLYFSELKEKDDLIYKSIVDKIKYFDPAFHSITPEGFNARLTFLHQCTRQGPTHAIGENGNKIAGNLAFGKSPYCVLRIGDFFNTKIVIESVSIDYKNGNGVQWDLNPEGIGVQPMMAKVNISFKFIGGQDIGGPIERLQNATSFNYYANTSIYDRHADYIVKGEDSNSGYKVTYNAMESKVYKEKNNE